MTQLKDQYLDLNLQFDEEKLNQEEIKNTKHDHGHGQECCSHKHKFSPNSKIHNHKNGNSSLLDSTFLHQIGDLGQDIGLLIVSIILYFKPSWDIIDPIISIIVSIISIIFF